MLLLLALLAVVASGCNEYPQSTFQNRSDFALAIDSLFQWILWAAAAVFVAVQGALIYTLVRFRRRPNDPLPKQVHGSTKLEIGWTIAPAIVLATVLVPSTATIFTTQAAPPEEALTIQVTGYRFWWGFEYEGADGQGVVTANEVHMPVDRPVHFEMRSADVIHSFWIPALGGKRDVVPSHTNHLWWTPWETGEYLGQCAELCGDSHANMRLRAFVQTEEDFQAWLSRQAQPAGTPPQGTPAAQGAQVFAQRGCGACHAVRGTQHAGQTAPDLTHFSSRTTFAAGMFPNDDEHLRQWLEDPPAMKPQVAMPDLGLGAEDIDALIAYLRFLQ